MKGRILIFLVSIMAMASLACGSPPLEALKAPMEKVITVLKDPQYQEAAQKGLQKEKIWQVIREIFDFTEVAKRTLARNWERFTPEQRQEFTDVFAEFLGNTYLDKMQEVRQDEKVVYVGEDIISDSKAQVSTKILTATMEIPVDYSMWLRDGHWRVYDVNIQGVSLVKNYRSQFNEILFKESPAQLIERLKKKVQR